MLSIINAWLHDWNLPYELAMSLLLALVFGAFVGAVRGISYLLDRDSK